MPDRKYVVLMVCSVEGLDDGQTSTDVYGPFNSDYEAGQWATERANSAQVKQCEVLDIVSPTEWINEPVKA
jgi:hypothetical protein